MIDVKEVLVGGAQCATDGARGRGQPQDNDLYIEAAKSLGLAPGAELTNEAVRDVATRVQSRPVPAVSDPGQVFEVQRARIEKWPRQDKPLTLVRIAELLARDGTAVSYTTLRRWVHAERGSSRMPTARASATTRNRTTRVDFTGHVSGARRAHFRRPLASRPLSPS